MQREEEVVYLYLDDIIPNRFQPREVFDEKPLKELAVSIKEHGVIQPIIVRKVNDKYEIIAGERRYKASALAGLTKIPAIIRDLDDKETSKVALLENLQRKNLNPMEEAKTYQKILEIDQMTQDELAKTMGKSQSAVANKIRLLSLPDEVQEALLKEQISERHARSLLNLGSPEEQKEMLEKIIANKMTVKQVENEIKGNSGNQENDELGDEINRPISNDVPSEVNFIPNNPLMPNLNGENENQSAPILTSIPTTPLVENVDSEQKSNKFINFGDISNDNIDDTEQNGQELFIENGTQPINLEMLKENAVDINTPAATSSEKNQGLDSLLNIIPPPIPTDDEQDNFKFFSPAKEAIIDSEKEVENNNEDYFQAPDLIPVELPEQVQVNDINSTTLNNGVINNNSVTLTENNTINQAIDKIRQTIKEIENMGFKIEQDEMDLNNMYQIVLKIEK